eukprot:6456209-Prymnesium_polylepis.1
MDGDSARDSIDEAYIGSLVQSLFDQGVLRFAAGAKTSPARFMGALMGSSPAEILRSCRAPALRQFDGTPQTMRKISQSTLFKLVMMAIQKHERLESRNGQGGQKYIFGAEEVPEKVGELINAFVEAAKVGGVAGGVQAGGGGSGVCVGGVSGVSVAGGVVGPAYDDRVLGRRLRIWWRGDVGEP